MRLLDLNLDPKIKIKLLGGKLKNKQTDEILLYSTEHLQKLTKLSYGECVEIQKALATLSYKCHNFVHNSIYIGIDLIDKTLGGGIRLKTVTEISGCSGTGKTQFCLQLAAKFLLQNTNSNSYVLYINTENAFPINRFKQILTACHMCGRRINNITECLLLDHIGDIKSLWFCLKKKVNLLINSGKNICLIIIDSIASLFRGAKTPQLELENCKNNNKTETNSNFQITNDIREIGRCLLELVQNNNLAVVCINQMSDMIEMNINTPNYQYYNGMGYFKVLNNNAKSQECIMFENEHKIPCLGLTWANFVTTRLLITKNPTYESSNGNLTEQQMNDDTLKTNYIANPRFLHVISSPYASYSITKFYITPDGIRENYV